MKCQACDRPLGEYLWSDGERICRPCWDWARGIYLVMHERLRFLRVGSERHRELRRLLSS